MVPESRAPLDPTMCAAWSRQAAAGDQDALERLLWAHHARLLGFARRKVGVDWRAKIDPDDILQEAYIDIVSSISSFTSHGEDSFYHWATRIIDHRFIDHVRRWRRKKRDVTRELRRRITTSTGTQSLLERCLADARTPSGAMRREDAVGALMACLARLPEHYRLVVRRLYLDQEPLSAVAADLNRSEDAVRRLAGRALERLARCMGRASRFLSTSG